MERSKKHELVDRLKAGFAESEAVFIVNQDRMTVAETEDLRKKLRGVASSYFVCKNTLAKLAAKGTSFECVTSHFSGQSAIVFSKNLTGSAKVIDEYASKSEDKVTVVCGGYNGNLLSVSDVKTLAKLPSMDELRAKIIAIVQTPAQRLAVLAQAPAGQIARVLKAYSEK